MHRLTTDPTPEGEWRNGLPALSLALVLWLTETLFPETDVGLALSAFLPLHTGLEVFSLILAALAFALFWRVPESVRRTGIMLLAATMLGATWLDFMHAMSYKGMPQLVTAAGPEKSIAFWLSGRLLVTLGLLAAAFVPDGMKVSARQRLGVLGLIVGLTLLMTWGVLWHGDMLPRTFMPGTGLTGFKVGSELLLTALLALAAVGLLRSARRQGSVHAATLANAAAMAAAGELCFSSYSTVTDGLSVLGHLCKIAAYWQITRAAYLLAVRQPLQAVSGLAEALQATVSPSAICGPDGQVQWVNRAFETTTGYAADEIVGRSISRLSDEVHSEAAQQAMAALRQGQAWKGQVPVRRRDGSTFLDDRSVTPMRDARGHLTGFVIVGDDVTERARAARMVEEAAERMRVLMQAAPDAVVVIDQHGLMQLANRQAEQLFGYSADELIGANVKLLMPEGVARRHDGFLAHYAETGDAHIIGNGRDLVGRRKDGGELHVHLTVGEARLASGTVFIGFMRDISERFAAQRELAEREARYRALMDTALDGVWIADMRGNFIAVNDAYLRLSGYSRAELLRMRIEDVEASENPAEVARHIERVMSLGQDQFETVHRDKSGRRWPVEVTVTHWPLGEGQMFVFLRDLTQRKADEAALRQSQERYALALHGTNDGLWDRNIVDDTIYFSPRWKEMLGYRDDELENSRAVFAALLHSDDALRVYLTLGDVASGQGAERFEIEMRLRHKAGHWVHVLSRGQLVRDEAGMPSRLVGTHQDLTEKRNAEKGLRESEDKLRKLFELSPLGIALCTLDGALVDFNESYRQITGYDAEALRQLTYWDLTPTEYMASEGQQLDLVVRQGRYGPYEKEYRRPDGSRVPARLNGVLLEIDGRPHLWSIIENLTETRQIEAERQALLRHQAQSQKLEALGHLTGGIAHDFNNMLAGIMGLASLGLERHVDDPGGKLARYLSEIVRTSERGRDLVAKMLAYARTEEPETVDARDIGPLIGQMRDMLATSIPAGIRLSCSVQAGLPAVHISAADVHQIVMNLVLNARDAIGEHGNIAIDVRMELLDETACISCGEAARGPHVVVDVRDDGSGIPEGIQAKIFDPFFTTKDVGRGTGLGLSSVLGAVHKAGGHMQVQSRPGATLMRVLLPAASPAPAPQAVGVAMAGATAMAAPSPGSVWVVDDDPAVLVFLTELLREHDLEVRSFADPLDALQALRGPDQPPAALITDQTMPGLSGTDLAGRVLKDHPGVGIILCTGYSEHVDAHSARALGIGHFLRKPFDSRQLLDALADVLRSTVP